MAWIAIDAGTSVIKAVAFAEDGREIAVARRMTTVLHPRTDFSEQEMESVWNAVVETVREVAQQTKEGIRGLASTAQGDGCWLVDEAGRPTGNAILWNDGRATEIVEAWRKSGLVERSFRTSGSVTYPGLPNAIWAWLDQHEPERIRRAYWSLTCNGWIHSQLTGRFIADLSDASNPFSDVVLEEYSRETLAIYQLERYASLLPPLAKGKSACAPLAKAVAVVLGLSPGIPVVMAPYDIVATAYGAGATKAGQACLILGTTVCAEAITASLDLSAEPTGTTIALSNGLYLRAMPTLTGCEALDWTASTLQVDGLDALSELAAEAEVGSGGVYFLPYLSPAGERSPFLDPAARGSFHGISLLTNRKQMVRSVYEGLSFVIRECLEKATNSRLHALQVCGGGARSNLWCQMIADVTGVPVVRATNSEAGARGAYLFALTATGEIENLSEGVRRFVTDTTMFQPCPDAHHFYTEQFATFLKLRDFAAEQWHLLAGKR